MALTEVSPDRLIGRDTGVCVATWQSRSPELMQNNLRLALPAIAHLNRVANCFCQSMDSVGRLEATGQKKAGGLNKLAWRREARDGQSSIFARAG